MRWRTALVVTTLTIAALYTFVVGVALVTSGNELLRQPVAYYAALMPYVYFTFCLLTAAERIPNRSLRTAGIIVHLATLPCLAVSFLGIGLLFPLLAFLWFRVYQWRTDGTYLV